jgi:voltage-gated potassium channel
MPQLNRIYRRFFVIAVLLAAVLAFGTLGFILIADYPAFDAFYMAVITITTVGYLEVHPLGTAGRAFNSVLLLVGVTIMFYAVGVITQTVLETQFTDFFAKRRVRKMIDQLKDHYILCGFGRVGRGAAAELQRAGASFVVMDRSEERVERALRLGMLAVEADATRDEMLEEVGIRRARGLVAALATDADNLFLILSAKNLNPDLKVSARVGEEASVSKMRRAGADALFMPYVMTGYRLAQSILRPHVFEFLDVTSAASVGMNVGIEQIEIKPGSQFTGRSLSDLQLRRQLGVIVLAIRRREGAMQFNPPAEAIIETSDFLIVMGSSEDVRKLETMVSS